MAERLDGTVALVTGASSGIGAATALELSELGASVALVARRSERLDELATKIRGQGGRSLALPADITDESQAREVIERAATELGRLDTLVNNAGVMLLGPVEDAPLTEWQRMVNINVLGLLYCTHAALPHLLDAVSTSPRRVATWSTSAPWRAAPCAVEARRTTRPSTRWAPSVRPSGRR